MEASAGNVFKARYPSPYLEFTLQPGPVAGELNPATLSVSR